MEKDNNNKVVKILIGVVIILSTIILFSGVFYILNMQKKITKLEEKQKEQLNQQIEKPVPTTEVIQPQTNNETEEQTQQATDSKTASQKSKKNSSKRQTETIINKSQIDNKEIEGIIDDTINKMDQQGNETPKNQKKDDDKLSKQIENILK
jgi:hypothetical protein